MMSIHTLYVSPKFSLIFFLSYELKKFCLPNIDTSLHDQATIIDVDKDEKDCILV